ncbi:hypothetical protein D3C75_900580 [compost metagenome]
MIQRFGQMLPLHGYCAVIAPKRGQQRGLIRTIQPGKQVGDLLPQGIFKMMLAAHHLLISLCDIRGLQLRYRCCRLRLAANMKLFESRGDRFMAGKSCARFSVILANQTLRQRGAATKGNQ